CWSNKGTASEVLVVSTAKENISTAGRTVTYTRRSEEQRKRKDKGKAIMTESEPKKKSKKEPEQEKLSFTEAIRLQEQMDEEQRAHIARDEEIARQWDVEERQRATSEAKAKRKKYLPRKRRIVKRQKRQKVEEDAEKEELKGFLDIIPREDVAEDVESLSTKYPIVDWKTYTLTENFMYYQIFRGDGSSKNYKVLSEMLEDFDRQDVEELYRLVKERYSASRPEGYDLMLWGDLHTLFEPDEEDEIWKNQHEYNVISWSLYDFCGIHILLMQNGIAIHMLTEKKYPLSQETITKMLNKRLEVDHESSQAFELLSTNGVSTASTYLVLPELVNTARRKINTADVWMNKPDLRNFDLEVIELENTQNNALAKLPMLKLGEYEMWEIRIKQYFQIQDYALWEVIENGNSWVPIPVIAQETGPSTASKMTVPSTAEEKTCKKDDVKARSLLLMALPNEHQLTFDQNWNQGSSTKTVKIEDASEKVMCAIDGAGFDWSDMAEEEIQETWLSWHSPISESTYKRGLATLEGQIVKYIEHEVLFSEEIALLKRSVGLEEFKEHEVIDMVVGLLV
ncbi:hypothetical protein Tco_0603115, partial [Tanacetum coccineum]